MRWFLPVTGDLRVGGRFATEGNADGEIRECERPVEARADVGRAGERRDAAARPGRRRRNGARARAHRAVGVRRRTRAAACTSVPAGTAPCWDSGSTCPATRSATRARRRTRRRCWSSTPGLDPALGGRRAGVGPGHRGADRGVRRGRHGAVHDASGEGHVTTRGQSDGDVTPGRRPGRRRVPPHLSGPAGDGVGLAHGVRPARPLVRLVHRRRPPRRGRPSHHHRTRGRRWSRPTGPDRGVRAASPAAGLVERATGTRGDLRWTSRRQRTGPCWTSGRCCRPGSPRRTSGPAGTGTSTGSAQTWPGEPFPAWADYEALGEHYA